MNQIELYQKLNSNNEINFIAFAYTPWHAHGVCAALNKLAKTVKLNGIVLIGKASEKDYIITKDNFKINGNIEYHQFCYEFQQRNIFEKIKYQLQYKKYYSNIKNNKRIIYFINPGTPNYCLLNESATACDDIYFKNIIVDEGLGTYMRGPISWSLERYKITKSAKDLVKELFNHCFINNKFDNSLKKHNDYINYRLLKEFNKGLVANEDIVEYYKDSIIDASVTISNKDYFENSLVLNLQLYYQTQQLKNDLSIYESIIDCADKNGVKTIIKAHPRDTDKYRYSILKAKFEKDNKTSQESILASLKIKPKAIVAFTSTSLVTAKLLFGVKAISINNLVDNSNIDKSLKREFKNFNKAFKNIVEIPNNIEEFENMIK